MSDLKTFQLVNLCKKQDQKAQLRLYNNYCEAMFNVSFRIVQDIYVAEDMMQEAFIKAFSQLDRLNDPKMFGSWLKKIVINNSLNYIHREKKNTFNVSIDEVLYKVEDEPDLYIDSSDAKLKEVLNAIRELKDNYRIVLSLHYIEGYDYEEIVEITGMSYSNCRTTISRAKESLKKKLEVYV
ncbi:MAG: RNA polymerase sigma factor [Flavobacteriaceae bacterium]|nr:RNA polymerase sigma factor [Flavobacteriaceae bacterium]